MTDWMAGCCHPTGGPHGKNEPLSCCHVHVEDLPSNHDKQQGETPLPSDGWTAQAQHQEDTLVQAIAEHEEEDAPVQVQRHTHRI